MRRYTRPEEPTKAENRQRRLKELSDAKVKNWPNTLEATRKKKESWKQERLAEEEAARKKIDAEEAELFHKARRAALDRAKTIVYEQQDKVKNLRSQQMYSDVLYDREEQIREKAVMRESAALSRRCVAPPARSKHASAATRHACPRRAARVARGTCRRAGGAPRGADG